jgi:hypothetical protein
MKPIQCFKWPWYFRVPFALLIVVPIVVIAMVLEAAWKAVVAFYEAVDVEFLWLLLCGVFIGDRD